MAKTESRRDAHSIRSAELLVSSAHLVSEKSGELSEFEFGLIIAGHAFNRWVVRCMAAAGIKDLTTLDVLLLHHVNHRAREKKLGDIRFMLNIEDTHVVSFRVSVRTVRKISSWANWRAFSGRCPGSMIELRGPRRRFDRGVTAFPGSRFAGPP